MADKGEDVTRVSSSERTEPMSDPSTPSPRVPVGELARRQRNLVILAAVLAVVCFLGGGGSGNLAAGVFLAVGIGLALLNTLVTEWSMMRMTASGDDLSRKQFAMSALLRLSVVSLVAFVLVVVFWPAGGFVLVGLAVFQLLTVALTGFPLLKELRNS